MSDVKDLKALDLLYHGKSGENIDVYLTRFEGVANINRWNEEKRTRLLQMALRDSALDWYLHSCSILEEAGPITYEGLRIALRQRFQTPNLEYFARMELARMVQGPMEDVSSLAARVQSVGAMAFPQFDAIERGKMLIAPFINGLKDPAIQAQVLAAQPPSFTIAMTSACNLEAAHGANAGQSQLYPAAPIPQANAVVRATPGVNATIDRLQFQHGMVQGTPRQQYRGVEFKYDPQGRPICNYCQKVGHTVRSCKKRESDESAERSRWNRQRTEPPPQRPLGRSNPNRGYPSVATVATTTSKSQDGQVDPDVTNLLEKVDKQFESLQSDVQTALTRIGGMEEILTYSRR